MGGGQKTERGLLRLAFHINRVITKAVGTLKSCRLAGGWRRASKRGKY